jgi:hypothetical protein
MSGIASTGVRTTAKYPPTHSPARTRTIRNVFFRHQRMMASTMV